MTTATSVHPGLASSLVDCGVEKASGIATATRGKLKRLFCVEEGYLTYAASNIVEEQFSELLIAEKLVSVGDLATARQQSEGRQVKLTRWLVDEGIVDEPTLQRVLEEYVRDLLFSTLDWSDGDSSLARGRPDLAGEVRIRLPCVSLILDYAKRFPASLDEVRRRIGALSGTLTRCDGRAEILTGSGLDEATSFLLTGSDEDAVAQDLIQSAPGGEESALRALYSLLLIGAVELSVPQADAVTDSLSSRAEIVARLERAEIADAYDVLEVPSTVSRQRIRESYYDLARQFHPDRFRIGELTDLLPRIETYFARVTEAYNTLHDPRLRAEYDEQRTERPSDQPQQDTGYLAEENFRLAKTLIAKGRLKDALTSLENAVQLQARNPIYRLELGRLLVQNPLMRRQAEEHLLECTRLDPSKAEAYYLLGELYLKQGRTTDAAQFFSETRRWDPSHEAAGKRLSELGAG